MPIRDVTRVSGSLMDVARLSELPDDDCNVLLVSSRTLYMLANYAVNEANFIARYYLEEFDGNLVRVAEEGDPEVPLIREIAQAFRLEVVPVTCDLVSELQAIAAAINNLQLAGCCPPVGIVPSPGQTGEAAPPPEGYREYDGLIVDRKCKLANMAVDDLLAVINLLLINDVDNIANLGVGAMSAMWALVVAAIPAGPVAWALAGIGSIASLIGFFLVNSLDLGDLITIIEANREDLVCCSYVAIDNEEAYDCWKTVLSDGGANSLDLLFLDTLHLLDGLATVFYAPDEGTGDEIEARLDGYVATTDCDVCPSHPGLWQIAPAGGELAETATGFLGSGTVNNFGSEFTINSVQSTESPFAHHIALCVTDWASQLPAVGWFIPGYTVVTFGGTVTWVSGSSGGPFTEIRGVRALLANCGGAPPGGSTFGDVPSTADNNQFIHWVRTVPFSMTFRIDVLPTLCP